MAVYGNFNTNKKKKIKKTVIGIIIAAAVVLAGIYIIGIIARMNGSEGREISSAVSENVRLRQEISEKEDEIRRLEDEINTLKATLNERPVPTPEPSAEPDGDASGTGGGSSYGDTDDEERFSPRSGNVR